MEINKWNVNFFVLFLLLVNTVYVNGDGKLLVFFVEVRF